MKKVLTLIVFVLLCLSFGISVNAATYETWSGISKLDKYKQVDTEFRAVWVATVWNIDIPAMKGNSEKDIEAWKANYLKILDDAQAYNMNTIIFQVRPCNDAFYPSKYNPWSAYLFGGKDPGFDPVEWMIEVTHARGLEYHAWLNPYRSSPNVGVTINTNTGTADNPIYQVGDYDNEEIQNHKHTYFGALKDASGKMSDGTPIDNPVFATGDELEHNVVLGSENMYVLNPASENTITHLENTIRELVENYDIDGIHFDDYFYPDDKAYYTLGTNPDFKGHTFSTESLVDYADYTEYVKNGGTLDLYNWRRSNVDNLIESLSVLIRDLNKEKTIPCAFGISPSPFWAPAIESCPVGSNRPAEGGMVSGCNNYYSYSDLYANTKKWVEEQWVDYILPQAYTYLANTYRDIVDWWTDVVSDTSVKLYAGTSLGSLSEWGNTSTLEISHQIRYNNAKQNAVEGYSLFSYKNLISGLGEKGIKNVKAYNWKTNALTPLYDNYTYKKTVEDVAKVSLIEEIADGYLRIKYNLISDAKAYGLYKVVSGTDITSDSFTPDALIQLNLKAQDYFDLSVYDEAYDYYVVTFSQDNSKYFNQKIDFSVTKYNDEPTIELVSGFNKTVNIDTNVELTFKLEDKNGDELNASAYLIYRTNENLLTDVLIEENTLTVKWTAYSVSTNNLKFKIVVSDGKSETIYETEVFNVVECTHTWVDATCDAPKTCIGCGVTEGEALGHTWVDATCDAPKTCTGCGATEGEALGHTWVDAICDAPKTCSVCGKTEGAALGHSWVDATVDAPKTCSKCGKTEGEKLPPVENDEPTPKKKGCKKSSLANLALSLGLLTTGLVILRKKK